MGFIKKNLPPVSDQLELQRKYKELKELFEKDHAEHIETERNLLQKNKDNSYLSALSFALSEATDKDIIKDIAVASIKEYTQAVFVQFTLYKPERKALILHHLETSSELVNSVVKMAGEKILSTVSLVSDDDYQKILNQGVTHLNSLNELTFGAISKAMDKAISRLSGCTEYLVVSHVHSKRLFGTTLLAFKKDQFLPSKELLISYSNILAVALRNKKTEQALNESEANLKAVAENTIESIWSVDTNYRILYINEVFRNSYKQIFGVSMQKGDNVLDALPKTIRSVWKDRYDRAFRNEQFTVVDKIKGPEEFVHVEVAMNPILVDGKVSGVSIFGKDISKEKKSEQTLLYTLERNKALLNTNPDLMFVFDSDYHIIDYHAGKGGDDLYARPEEFLGKQIDGILPQDISENTKLKIEEVLQTKEPASYTYELTRNGRADHYEARYVLSGEKEVMAIVRNINKEKEAEKNLHENQANLNAILENSLESIWSIDLEYNIQYVNEVFATSFQNTFGVLLAKGVNVYEALPETLREVWKKRYDRAFKNEHFVFTEEIEVANSVIYVEVAINPILINNKVVGASLYGRDITESKLSEFQLIAAKEKAEESDRLKSAFLANMSHEIRTPMNGILGFSSLLKQPGLEGEQQMEFIEIIQKSGERMLNIINDLINISKIEAGQIELSVSETNLHEQCTFLFNFFTSEAKSKGVEILMNCPPDSEQTIVSTDKEKVNAILLNLISNAIKFTEQGKIEFGYQIQEDFYEFFVKDTGIGIPKEKTQLIFDRFIQVDSSISSGYEGSGLGLSISKAYVEIIGGSIWVESEPGRGSCFYFTIPVLDAQMKTIPTTRIKSLNYPPGKTKFTLLIAEDDESSALYISHVLADGPFNFLYAKTGEEAIDMCKKHPEIKMILMDIKMPDLDGYSASKLIKEFRPKLPIIAQTAFALVSEKMKFGDAFDEYITKPIDPEELREKITFFLKNPNLEK